MAAVILDLQDVTAAAPSTTTYVIQYGTTSVMYYTSPSYWTPYSALATQFHSQAAATTEAATLKVAGQTITVKVFP